MTFVSWFQVFGELGDTLCIVTTLVLIILLPLNNIMVHGHENDAVLKLGRLYSFHFQ